MSDVKILKLINGDDIIADVNREKDVLEIDSPAKILIQLTEQGVGTSLIPWNLYSDEDKFVINKNHIIAEITPGIDMHNQYNQDFGSGIEIVENNHGGLIL